MDAWPFNPDDDLMVRKVVGPDGQVRLQIRLELGILEMMPSGRPDGAQPYGFESLLAFHLDRVRHERDGDGEPYRLSHEEALALQREAMQYYHRRVTWFKLGDFAAAADDAEHNIAVMDLLKERAADSSDWLESEQYRPFVLSHLVRARALWWVDQGDPNAALSALDDGIDSLETLFRDDYRRPDLITESEELHGLLELRRALRESPTTVASIRRESETERLRRELAEAVAREEYERAATLRDALREAQARVRVDQPS
jgi:hypothetical protein